MIPGKQKGQKVVVPYSLPILFKVAENSSELNKGINAEKGTKIEESIKDLKNQLKNRTNENGLPFAIVDKVPTLPECEHLSTNKSQRKCVSDAIIKVVQKNFNTDLAGKLGLKGKRQIMVVFQINKQGNIKNIRARGPHPDLEAEAIRTVKLLPKFVPGEDKGKKISVSYSLPIVFMVK
jgi:outer membrane biosynthesis protein TonB